MYDYDASEPDVICKLLAARFPSHDTLPADVQYLRKRSRPGRQTRRDADSRMMSESLSGTLLTVLLACGNIHGGDDNW